MRSCFGFVLLFTVFLWPAVALSQQDALSKKDAIRIQKLIQAKKTDKATAMLGEKAWWDRGFEEDVSESFIAQFRADVGVLARQRGELNEAILCLAHALFRKSNPHQAAALYEASLLVKKMSGDELVSMGQLYRKAKRAHLSNPFTRGDTGDSCSFDGDGDDAMALSKEAMKSDGAAAIFTCLVEHLAEQRAKTPASIPDLLSRSLLLSAAHTWPRDVYLSRLSEKERRHVLERASLLELSRFEPLPSGVSLKDFLFTRTFGAYEIKKGVKREELTSLKALKRALVYKDIGALVYKPKKTTHRFEDGQAFHVYHICAGHDDSPGSAWFVNYASRAFIVHESRDGVHQVLDMGRSEICAELRADAKLTSKVAHAPSNLLAVKLYSYAYEGNGPQHSSTQELVCHAHDREPVCLINAYGEFWYEAGEEELADASTRVAPHLSVSKDGHIMLTGGTPISEYEALDDKRFEVWRDEFPTRTQILERFTKPEKDTP